MTAIQMCWTRTATLTAIAAAAVLTVSMTTLPPAERAAAVSSAPVTTAELAAVGPLTFTMTDNLSGSDTCSFSSGAAAEHCQGFLDSPSGGTQNGTGSFAGTMSAVVSVSNIDGLVTPGTGSGPFTEIVSTLQSSVLGQDVPSNLGVGFGDGSCGLVTVRSAEGYQGSTSPGTFTVTGLRAVSDSSGAVTDLSLNVSDGQVPAEATQEQDTLLAPAQNPDPPGCRPPSGYNVDYQGAQGGIYYAMGTPDNIELPPSLGAGMTGWTIDPSGTWTPESGGILAQKTVTTQTPFTAPDAGAVTNSRTYQIVTGVCAATTSSAPPGAQASSGAASSCLTAKPGGPYDKVRAQQVTLQDSGSTDNSGHTITRWHWTWEPGPNCPPGTALSSAGADGKQVTITVLCDLKVKLTVTDDATPPNTATGATTITVTARTTGWDTTPPHYAVGPPGHAGTPRGDPTLGSTVGRNVSACDPADLNSALCPAPEHGSWWKHGYTIATVSDPHGPFDRFTYIASTSMNVSTIGLFNPSYLSGARPPVGACRIRKPQLATCRNFVQENGVQAAAYMTRVRMHEGLGGGRPRSGHAQAQATAAKTPQGNVRKLLEPVMSLTGSGSPELLAVKADPIVQDAGDWIWHQARDPLTSLGNFWLRLWVPAHGTATGSWQRYLIGTTSR